MASKKYLVFTIPKCNRCVEVKKVLDEQGIEYKEIKVMESQKNKDLAIKYNIQLGGTIIDDETGEVVDI